MLRKKRVLILEDSSSFQAILSKLFEDEFEFEILSEATKAIEFCYEFKPDLILLDIMLEGDTDGLAFLSIIKSNNNLNHIPVILISSLDSNEIITQGLKLGANDYLTKPFNLNQLLLKIKNLLQLGILTRQQAVLEKEIPFIISKSRSADLIEKLNKIIERVIGLSEDVTIVDIANELHISQSTLTRLVKTHFKMTTNAFIMNKKLDKAKLLIQSKKGLAIKEISFSLGFASVSYFSKCYKKRFGQFPSATKK